MYTLLVYRPFILCIFIYFIYFYCNSQQRGLIKPNEKYVQIGLGQTYQAILFFFSIFGLLNRHYINSNQLFKMKMYMY